MARDCSSSPTEAPGSKTLDTTDQALWATGRAFLSSSLRGINDSLTDRQTDRREEEGSKGKERRIELAGKAEIQGLERTVRSTKELERRAIVQTEGTAYLRKPRRQDNRYLL